MEIDFKIIGSNMIAVSDNALKKAIREVSSQALSDCNKYCKLDTGALIQSSVTHSDLDKGVLVWDTPYAEGQYDFPAARQDKNPLATSEWCRWAENTCGNNWEHIFVNTLNREGLG